MKPDVSFFSPQQQLRKAKGQLSGRRNSNFVNHCYCVAAKILEYSGLPFSVMHALIDETADKVKTMHPSDAQTGPAVRYD